jgi:hypothetical protein
VLGAAIAVGLLVLVGRLLLSGVVTNPLEDVADGTGDSAMDGTQAPGETDSSVAESNSTSEQTESSNAESTLRSEAYAPPVDATALQKANTERLTSAGSVTIAAETTVESTGQDATSRENSFTALVDVDNNRVITEFSTDGQTRTAYRAGTEKYERIEYQTGDVEYRVPDRDMSAVSYVNSSILGELETVDVEHRETDTGHLYTASGTEAVSDGFLRISGDSIQSFDFEVAVSDQGVFRQSSYRVEIETDTGSNTVSSSIETRDVGTTEVPEPRWLDAAREATN